LRSQYTAIAAWLGALPRDVLVLTFAAGLPFEVKRLAYWPGSRLLDVWRGTTLIGIRRRGSSVLGPPWPDLVVSASMRNEPVCRWIRRQSGNQTRYVHLGKPWANVSTFDLVITVPEYRWVPDAPNVQRNACSLHEVTPERLAEAAKAWAPSVEALPRPFVAVLVGGYAGPYPFDRETAERLGREASALARARGGSLLVTTSHRTSRAASTALAGAIDVPCFFHRWERGANPYFGLLGLADEIIVTCDSTSMLAEACATRKPVHVFDLTATIGGSGWRARLRRCNWDRVKGLLYRNVLLRLGPDRIKRDIRLVADDLIGAGRAIPLGQPFPKRRQAPFDEMPRTLDRIGQLLDEREASSSETYSR